MITFSKLIQNYDDIVNAVIQPPRQDYSNHDLGPRDLDVKGKLIRRSDLRLRNRRGYTIECSHFEPINSKGQTPCVIYLHPQGGSRLEALKHLETICLNGMSLFCFDFCGSGKSGGLYCSLGWFEQDDLECVIQYLANTEKVSRIAVWGRSMGAITALLYAKHDPRISCMIVDSPFTSFKQFAADFIKQKANLSNLITSAALSIVKKSIKARANFDIKLIDPLSNVSSLKCPVLFATAEGDTLIPATHTQKLYQHHPGPKKLVTFLGDHNTERPQSFLLDVAKFLQEHLANTSQTEPQVQKEKKSTVDEFKSNHTGRNESVLRMSTTCIRKGSLEENIAKMKIFQSVERNLERNLNVRKESGIQITPFAVSRSSSVNAGALENDRETILNASKVSEKKSDRKLAFTWLVEDNLFARNLSHSKSSGILESKRNGGGSAGPKTLRGNQETEEIFSENAANNPNSNMFKQKNQDASPVVNPFSLAETSKNQIIQNEGDSMRNDSPSSLSFGESFYIRNQVRDTPVSNFQDLNLINCETPSGKISQRRNTAAPVSMMKTKFAAISTKERPLLINKPFRPNLETYKVENVKKLPENREVQISKGGIRKNEKEQTKQDSFIKTAPHVNQQRAYNNTTNPDRRIFENKLNITVTALENKLESSVIVSTKRDLSNLQERYSKSDMKLKTPLGQINLNHYPGLQPLEGQNSSAPFTPSSSQNSQKTSTPGPILTPKLLQEKNRLDFATPVRGDQKPLPPKPQSVKTLSIRT